MKNKEIANRIIIISNDIRIKYGIDGSRNSFFKDVEKFKLYLQDFFEKLKEFVNGKLNKWVYNYIESYKHRSLCEILSVCNYFGKEYKQMYLEVKLNDFNYDLLKEYTI